MSSRSSARRAPMRLLSVLAAVALATGIGVYVANTAAAMAVCKPEIGAKSVPLYDKPNGTVIRNVDIDPSWQGGPGLTLIAGGESAQATIWLEVKDANGTVIGYLSGADGGISCQAAG